MKWDEFTRNAEGRAQRIAGKYSREIKKLHKAQLVKLNAQIDALYAQVLDEGAKSLTRSQLYQYSKYQMLTKAIDEGTAEQQSAQNTAVEASIRQAYTSTLEQSLDALLGESGWNVVPESLLEQYLQIDWSGKQFSERIWKNTNALAARVKEHIADMIVQGKNPSAIKRQLMEDFGVSFDVADRLITTEASHAYNTAAIEGYRQAGLSQVKYLLDSSGNVCERCRAYATDVADGIYPINAAPSLPVHPRCHCCYAPVVDLAVSTQKAQNTTVYKGAEFGAIDYEDSPKAEAHAKQYYASVRSMKTDAPRIAQNIGWSEADVKLVKEHLFVREHDLGGVKKRFDESYSIAQSWQRLIDGKNITEGDLVLMQHERLEASLMQEGLNYEEAHQLAQKQFDYSTYVKYSTD